MFASATVCAHCRRQDGGGQLLCPRAVPLADQLERVLQLMVTRGTKEAQLDILLLFPQSFEISDLQSEATAVTDEQCCAVCTAWQTRPGLQKLQSGGLNHKRQCQILD